MPKVLCKHKFLVLWIYISENGIARSYGNSIFTFWETVKLFPELAVPFYNPTYYVWGFQLFLILSSTHYYFFLILAILVSMKLYLLVVLTCMSLMSNDAEHHFMYLLSIYVFFWEMPVPILWPFKKLGCVSFLLLSCRSSSYTLVTRPLSENIYQIFLPFCRSFYLLAILANFMSSSPWMWMSFHFIRSFIL